MKDKPNKDSGFSSLFVHMLSNCHKRREGNKPHSEKKNKIRPRASDTSTKTIEYASRACSNAGLYGKLSRVLLLFFLIKIAVAHMGGGWK